MKELYYLVASILLVFDCFTADHAKERAMTVTLKESVRRTALTIGNSAYRDTPLGNPVNDAKDMAKALEECGPVDAQTESESDVTCNPVDAGRVLGKMADAENGRNNFYFNTGDYDDVTIVLKPPAGSEPPPDAKRIGDHDENGILHWANVPGTNAYNPFTKAKKEVSNLIAETNSLGMKFVYIPPGTFAMGSLFGEPGRENDETRHRVTLTHGFYMQTTEVTQGQWRAVMGKNPSAFSNCGENCPVENVSWNDTQEFIQKLNQKEGKAYRLPTEAEWEYAARAGTTKPFNTGNCLSTDQANYDGNYPLFGCPYGQFRGRTLPVMSFASNAWGLYDMHGNVWEWCEDRKGDYPNGSVTDPTGSSSNSSRVLRGGGWDSYARFCRSANRGSDDPANWFRDGGFRLVLLPGQ